MTKTELMTAGSLWEGVKAVEIWKILERTSIITTANMD